MSKHNRLYKTISSIRLTIFICILLALVSVLGTLIPQNLGPHDYSRLYGSPWGAWIARLGLADLYHSAGFILLLVLLAVNLVACTVERLPPTWRAVRRRPRVPSESRMARWRYRERFVCKGLRREIEARLEEIVGKALGRRPQRVKASGEGLALLVERNRYSRLGPYLAHISILVILLGGLAGALGGFRGEVVLREGEVASTVRLSREGERVPLGFRIRCDRVVKELYPDGTPKEYRSEVTLLDEEGEAIRKGTVRVNHPLRWRGITFYQSDYGNTVDLVIEVQDRESGSARTVRTALNTPFLLPGDRGDRAVVLDFRESLRIPKAMMRRTSFTKSDLGPAARVAVLSDRGFGEPFWILEEFPERGRREKEAYRFVLKDYRPVPYTGLQAVKDPGTPLVWLGCILLVAGFFVALLMDHEILWVMGRPGREEGSYVVELAGRAVRHPRVYSARFEHRKEGLRRGLAPWLKS